MYLWDSQAASWAAVIANVAVGIRWIVALALFVREADELQRKIMLDALGVTLGAGWVLGFAYGSADVAGLLTRTLNIALFPVFLAFVYIIAIVVGNLRYR